MKLFAIISFLLVTLHFSAYSQKEDKLSPEQAKEILSQLNLDTAKFLKDYSTAACGCIDSIKLADKDHKEISEDISQCIDKQVVAYQAVIKMYRSLKSGGQDKEIIISADKNSKEYKQYYYEIERSLMDSCTSLKNAVASNNKESAFSMSTDSHALKEYNNGVDAMNKADFKKALSYFKNAVDIDPKFAFAWDNLGLCNRKIGNYEDALIAYNKSLTIDPWGSLPLQNIPIVYEYQKKYDKALEGYQNILKSYPDDPEAFYGIGRIYAYFIIDLEKALQNTCKAYNIYIKTNSPYRVDGEKQINYIYKQMKAAGNEKVFFDILKQNKIQIND